LNIVLLDELQAVELRIERKKRVIGVWEKGGRKKGETDFNCSKRS
jgi:hypothetical protein